MILIALKKFGSREAALVAAMTAAGLAATGSSLPAESNDVANMLDASDVQEEIRHARQLSRAFRSVAAVVAPSVVSIEVIDAAPYNGSRSRRSGEAAPGRMAPARVGQATGVVIDANGLVVTNNHVVETADEILVELNDGRRLDGTVIGKDEKTDLAVIKIDADDLIPHNWATLNPAKLVSGYSR